MEMNKYVSMIAAALLCALGCRAEVPFVSYGHTKRFIDLSVHGLAGGSYVTDNYAKCYSQISDLNNSMGVAWGVGAAAKFNISDFFGLSTEFNWIHSSGKMDMAVASTQEPNVSNVFVSNSYSAVDVPVYVSFAFNLARTVEWDVDGGMFLSFGTGGSQKSTIYNAKVNELGQLITSKSHLKTDYYDDSRGFINSYESFDCGLHLGTGLRFAGRVSVGVRSHIGLRNVAKSTGLIKPTSHNISVFATVGYHF